MNLYSMKPYLFVFGDNGAFVKCFAFFIITNMYIIIWRFSIGSCRIHIMRVRFACLISVGKFVVKPVWNIKNE